MTPTAPALVPPAAVRIVDVEAQLGDLQLPSGRAGDSYRRSWPWRGSAVIRSAPRSSRSTRPASCPGAGSLTSCTGNSTGSWRRHLPSGEPTVGHQGGGPR